VSSRSPRITPTLPSAWDEVALDALGAFPRGLAYVQAKWNADGQGAGGMYVLGTLALNPPLAKAFLTFNAHVSGANTLTTRVRELVILRLSWLRRAEYEYVHHVTLGMRAGLTKEEIVRIEEGPSAAGWSAVDVDLLQATDELCTHTAISKATWARLATHMNKEQMIELVFVIGCYELLAMAIKSFDLELEPGVPPLDPATRARMFREVK
jgi:4-carboxymuconolactone decarboxylase